TLQSQGQRPAGFGIGPFESMPFVPRLRYGRIMLREASWRLNGEQVESITKPSGAARVRAVRALRAATGLPRWICVEDGDNVLPVDLENVVSLDSFAHLIKYRDAVQLSELWPAPEELAVHGPDGRYTHEIVVPLIRVPESKPQAPAAERGNPRLRSSFTP